MFYDGLHFLKGLPSPEGVWERVQLIGEWCSTAGLHTLLNYAYFLRGESYFPSLH